MEMILTNCTIVTRTSLVHGTLVVEDGIIKNIDDQVFLTRNGIDLDGDLLLPGLIEMHTDNLEKNIQPRPGVIWPSILSATLSHDAQIAGAGITTVYDAIAVGGLRESSLRSRIFDESIAAISKGRRDRLFKAEHFLHLRCEVSDENMETMLLRHTDNPYIKLVSLMDHTPGQRQWSDLSRWRQYHRDKKWTDREAEAIVQDRTEMQKRYGSRHRTAAISFAQEKNIVLASHDDTTTKDIETAAREGISIAEFPTTLEAARSAQHSGMKTILGAPNLIRGESHSGNISATTLAEQNLLDGFSSDYVPSSLMQVPFLLREKLGFSLPECVAKVSCNIADMVGLPDRGEIAVGRRADLVRVRQVDSLPVIRTVWREGAQVA